MVTFKGHIPPASASQISAFEEAHSVNLPADYKEFLLTTNGGVPTPDCFCVPDRGDALCSILYGILSTREPADLEWEQVQANQWDPLPPGFIAIGHDPGGSTLLLATSGKDAGALFFWDHNGLWVHADGHNAFLIAASFTSFLALLREMPFDPELGT